MKTNGYTVDALAAALDLTPRQIAYYRSGESPISRVLELACKQLERSRHEKRA